jgi:hypothetical protein
MFKLLEHDWKILPLAAALSLMLALVLHAEVPRGWHLTGSKPAEYEAGVDAGQPHEGRNSAFLKSKTGSVDGFGTMMQSIPAEQYRGNKVRLSGLVKSEEVTDWAGLWMRVDKGTQLLAFDNMQKRPVKGTTGWLRYYVVLEVPKDATGIAFGILLSGPGQVWVNDVKFEIVGADAPATSAREKSPDTPVNLEFRE